MVLVVLNCLVEHRIVWLMHGRLCLLAVSLGDDRACCWLWASKTGIMYRANLNFSRFNRYFGEMVRGVAVVKSYIGSR